MENIAHGNAELQLGRRDESTPAVRVNGTNYEVSVREGALLAFLRGELGLTGAKPGCGEGECGTCTVLVDGRPVLSCQVRLESVASCSVTTIEGLASGGRLHPMQQALIEEAASQCGYCTPGMALRGAALLSEISDPDDDQIATALGPNICRCGCYVRIVEAVHRAAEITADPTHSCLEIPASVAPATVARPRRPWDLSAPEERDYFDVLGDGLVVVWPPRSNSPGIWPSDGGAWVHIAPSGMVTAFSGKVDVGQDNVTAFALLVGAELGVRLDEIRVIGGDTDLCPFDPGTFGSRSMPDAGEALRCAAAGAREVLCGLAASRWKTTRSAIVANDGAVSRRSAATILSYGDLVSGQRRVTVIEHEPELRVPSATRPASPQGRTASRLEAVTGRRRFVSDLDEPGMAHGAVLRPPVLGAVLRSVDLGAIVNLPDVTAIRDRGLVGVVAPNPMAARQAIEAIGAEWDLPSDEPDDVPSYLRSHPIAGVGWERPVDETTGGLEAALLTAPIVLGATYRTSYVAHVPMETRAALAKWEADRLTVWVGTQVPFGVRAQLAAALSLDEADVRVIVPPTGGGFGGKHGGDVAIEAARLARMANRPVKVHWSRGEEFQFGYLRPMALIDVRASVDSNGKIAAWDFLDINAGPAALSPPYVVGASRLRYQPAESPVAQGSYRALAATANNFARESFIDELAAKLDVDSLEFRLANLEDDRLETVLRTVADRFGWRSDRSSADGEAIGYGLAVGFEKGGRVATCAEVRVRDGRLDVTRIVTAYECGRVVNPDTVVNQIQGATVMALGGALFEEAAPSVSSLAQLSLSRYRVPRFSDVPIIEIVLIDRPDLASAGAGETPMITVAPAIANAIFSATGTRIRSLPLMRDAALN